MEFLEKNLEDIIYDADNSSLRARGLIIHGLKKRQVRVGNYGIADIVSLDREEFDPEYHIEHSRTIRITVMELKKNTVDANTAMQGYRYCQGIKRYLRKRFPNWYVEFTVIAVGRDLADGDFRYTIEFIPRLNIYTYEYRLDGLNFKIHSGYVLREEGF